MDMEQDVFAQFSSGKIALTKFAPVSADFRLFESEWLGDKPENWGVMKITGADFHVAKTGKDAGKRTILVKGTKRSVFVTRKEIQAAQAAATLPQEASIKS